MKATQKTIILFLLFICYSVSGLAQNCIYPAGTNLYVQNLDCSLSADICIDVPWADSGDYNFFIDGTPYTGTYNPCNYDTLYFYSVNTLFDHLNTAPAPNMVVDSVRINGQVYSFSFATIEDLVDSLNVIDNTAIWVYEPSSQRFLEGNLSSTYSDFRFTDLSTVTTFEAEFQSNATPSGLTISISNNIHEVVIEEIATSCRDTITAEAFCLSNTGRVDTILIDQIDTICFELSNLRGAVTSIINICPGQSGIATMIDPISSSGCIEVTALDIGRDSACLVIMDDEGLTDTIFYAVQVIDMIDSMDFYTRRDSFDLLIDESITVNPTANDRLPTAIDTIYISSDPIHGMASLNPDGTITYQPDIGYESNGVPDTLEYTICIASMCRTDIILFNVIPPMISIKEGFSPNADGINDTFIIENISEFPNNELCIFNRWGNQVYKVESYQNDWDGKWDASVDLPTGAYFYVLNVEVESEMEQHTGYVFLRR